MRAQISNPRAVCADILAQKILPGQWFCWLGKVYMRLQGGCQKTILAAEIGTGKIIMVSKCVYVQPFAMTDIHVSLVET